MMLPGRSGCSIVSCCECWVCGKTGCSCAVACVLGGNAVADDGRCAGWTDMAGGFPEPGQRWLRGPCWCTVPSRRWSCLMAWHTEHSPLALFASCDSGQDCGYDIVNTGELGVVPPILAQHGNSREFSNKTQICSTEGYLPTNVR